MTPRSRSLAAAVCGMFAPVLFAGGVAFLGFRRTDYSHLTQFISELGEHGAHDASAMNLILAAHGLLVIAFACGLAGQSIVLGPSLAPVALILIYGLGMTASGLVQCDPGCPMPGTTPEGTLHIVIGSVAGFALIVAAAWTSGTHKGRLWASYRRFTIACTAVMGLSLLGVVTGFATFYECAGLVQRVFFLTSFVWIEVSALRLFRLPAWFDSY